MRPWDPFLMFLRRRKCPHLVWEPIDSVLRPLDDDRVAISWSNQRCLRCGTLREGSIIQPGETVSIPLDGIWEYDD